MKVYRYFLAVCAAAAAVFLFVLFRLTGTGQQQERDMLMLNDTVQTVRAHFLQSQATPPALL